MRESRAVSAFTSWREWSWLVGRWAKLKRLVKMVSSSHHAMHAMTGTPRWAAGQAKWEVSRCSQSVLEAS